MEILLEGSADKLSCWFLIQQVIGVATVLSNITKAVGDLARIAFYKINSMADSNADEEVREIKGYLRDAEKDCIEHVTYIGIGILRAIPIIGTIYSNYRISQARNFVERPESSDLLYFSV